MLISVDKQLVSQHCEACDADFVVVRGSVFDDGEPIGLYLIALHGHSPAGRIAHLAVAILDQTTPEPMSFAVAMDVMALPSEYAFKLVDWEKSPWRTEMYLGVMLSSDEVRKSPHRSAYFHISEHIVNDLEEVRDYLA
jgi:hypothetical protein